MSLHRVVGIAGNLKRPSPTRAVVEAVAAALARRRDVDLSVYDLLDAGPGLGAGYARGDLTPEAARVVEAIETADALIVETPVYKGSYTGLFKHLFDLIDPGALSNKPVVLTATGGGPRHALVVEHQLRPLFGFFTALTVLTAVYASAGAGTLRGNRRRHRGPARRRRPARYGVEPMTAGDRASSSPSPTSSTGSGLSPSRSASGTRPGRRRPAEGAMAFDRLTPWLVPVAIVAAWQMGDIHGFVSTRFMPAPSDVLAAGWRLGAVGRAVDQHLGQLRPGATGFLIGGGIGFAFGLANGLSQLWRALTDTTLQMVRNIPHLALIPLVILWFGIDEAAKLFLVALGVFFPIYLNTLHGIRTVDPQLIEMGASTACRPGAVPAGDPARRAAVDLRRPALRARHHVADADRRRDHRRLVRPRLHGDAGARVHADRRRGAGDPDLRPARQARRQRLARARARYLSWHPAFRNL